MELKDTINTGKEIEKLNLIKPKNQFINIKSDYILKDYLVLCQQE